MAGSAVIGALRVDLGLNSAQFVRGLASAQKGLARFGVQLTLGVENIANAIGQAIGRIPEAIKGAIDRADDLNDLAQAAGVSAEALSRLAYAASFSNVSTEQMAGGLGKLSRAIVDASTKATGPAASAFAALGINIRDAQGHLRGADAIFAEIADKLSRMPDGATKTALAVALLGKSGAELIPTLNMGADGLARMADESDRLGLTISGKTAAAAGQFNDTIDRVTKTVEGTWAMIAEALLPALNYLASAFYELASDRAGMKSFLEGVVLIFKSVVTAAAVLAEQVRSVALALRTLGSAATDFISGPLFWGRALHTIETGFSEVGVSINETISFINGLWAAVDNAPSGNWFGKLFGGGKPTIDVPEIPDLGAGAAQMNRIAEEGKRVFEDTRTAAERYSLEIERLNMLLAAGAIDQDTYNRAVTKAQDTFREAEIAADKVGQAAKSIGETAGRSLKELVDGTKSWNEALGDVLLNLASVALQTALGPQIGIGGNLLSGVLGGFFGGNFANGGSFVVPGSGGIDSQFVGLNATPGERVSVTKDDGPMGGNVVQITNHVSLAGAVSPSGVAQIAGGIVQQATEGIKKAFPGWQVEYQQTGAIS